MAIASTPKDRNNLLYVNKKMLHIIIPIKHHTLKAANYIGFHKAALMLDSPDVDRAKLYKLAPKEVVIGMADSDSKHGAGWDYDRTIEVITRLRAVRALSLRRLNDFPYHKLPKWLSDMPTITTLEVMCPRHYGFLPRYFTPKIPSAFPKLTRLYMSGLLWTTAEQEMDQSTSILAHISSLSTLRSITMDVRSWVALGRGRRRDTLSVSSQLEELVIYPGDEVTLEELYSPAWVRGLFRALEHCSKTLCELRLEMPYEVKAHGCPVVVLSRLSVFIGPEGVLKKLMINGPLTVYWVSTDKQAVTVPGWESLWHAVGDPDSIRSLRVSVWNIQALHPSEVFSCLPNLEELYLTLSTELSKQALVDFGQTFKTCQQLRRVTMLAHPHRAISKGGATPHIAATWKEIAPNFTSICLDTDFVWECQYKHEDHRYEWEPTNLPWSPSKTAVLPVEFEKSSHVAITLNGSSGAGDIFYLDSDYDSSP
ncbi:hypothetical protein V5O48_014914 [Marasmius crinis-equi]|uniref:Uncharacterized protein n=1 Tax=Marasmius crinis-equi TaxID=585013 RepID=A0ABR3EW13_9AGAR